MWADTLGLTIGDWQVGLRVDASRSAGRLRTWLEPYLAASDSSPAPSNFSIQAPTGYVRRRPGRLFMGGTVIAESVSLDHLAGVLARRLSGLQRPEPPRLQLDMRAFHRNDDVVLVDVQRPVLTRDHRLTSHGITEIDTWFPTVDPDARTVVTDEVLAGLRWGEAGFTEQRSDAVERRLAGVVTPARDGRGDRSLAWARGRSHRDAWMEVLRDLERSDRLRGFPTPNDIAATVISLFDDIGIA